MRVVAQESDRLRSFQQQFARALMEPVPAADSGVARLVAQPGFAVYRNTVRKGCIDALQANYPAVTRLVGEEWMRAAAAVFAQTNLPATPMLLEYGEQFAAFLEGFPPAAELPYLAAVARLDRYWTEAHVASDEAPLGADPITALAPDELARTTLRPHVSARWAWFDEQPIFTIWSRNRGVAPPDGEIKWRGEGALIVRPLDSVQTTELGRAGAAFLDACAAGESLADAARAALAVDAAADLAQLMAGLLTAGAFGQIVTAPMETEVQPTGELP